MQRTKTLSAHATLKTRTLCAIGLLLMALAGCALLMFAGCSRGDHAHALVQSATANDAAGSAPAERGQALSVQTVVPSRTDLVRKFEQPAPVVPYEEAELYARVGGYVQNMDVDIGDVVKKGGKLLELDVPDVRQELAYKDALTHQAEAEKDESAAAVEAARAELIAWASQLAEADADVKKADADRQYRKRHAERYARLGAQDAVPHDQVEEKRDQAAAANATWDSAMAKRKAVEARQKILIAKLDGAKADLATKRRRMEVSQADRERTRVMLDYTTIHAPFAGIITQRTVDEGALVSAGSNGTGRPVLTLARIDKVTAVLRVPEREAGYVRLGMRAPMRLDALGGREVQGKVARFSHALDDKSRTMRVEIDIDNSSGHVYPGMYGPVALILQEIKKALTIPASAVYAVGGRSYVVQVQNKRARRIAVETGYDDGKVVQVTKGLSGDEEIVVSNKGQISEGQDLEPHRIEPTTEGEP